MAFVQDKVLRSEDRKAEWRTEWEKMRQTVVEVSQMNGSVADIDRAELVRRRS